MKKTYVPRLFNKDFCVTVFNVFSTTIIPNEIKCQKKAKKQGLVKSNWWWNLTCVSVAQFHWTLKFIFSSSLGKSFPLEFPWEIVSGVISGNYLYLKLYENAKKDCKIPKLILVLGFCPLKTEITWYPNRFGLYASG